MSDAKPITEAELDVMERDIKRWGPDRPHSVPLDANETNVLRLAAEVRRLKAIADRVNPEALDAEIQAVKDEHAAIMKRLEDGAVGALDRLLRAAKDVARGALDINELEAAIAAADALPDEMEAAEPDETDVERVCRELHDEGFSSLDFSEPAE